MFHRPSSEAFKQPPEALAENIWAAAPSDSEFRAAERRRCDNVDKPPPQSADMRVGMYAYMSVCMYVCTYVCMHALRRKQNTKEKPCVCPCVCVHEPISAMYSTCPSSSIFSIYIHYIMCIVASTSLGTNKHTTSSLRKILCKTLLPVGIFTVQCTLLWILNMEDPMDNISNTQI